MLLWTLWAAFIIYSALMYVAEAWLSLLPSPLLVCSYAAGVTGPEHLSARLARFLETYSTSASDPHDIFAINGWEDVGRNTALIICCACFVCMPVLMYEQPYHAEAPLFHPYLCTNSLLCSAYTGQPNWTLGLMCLGIVQIAKHIYSLTLAFLLNISIFFPCHSQISSKDTGRIFSYVYISC